MSRATIILRDETDRRAARHWVDKAPVGTSVTFKRNSRSLDQNSLMWARLTDISVQVEWYGQHLSADDWKDIMTASLRRARVVPGLDAGTFVPLGMRTSEFTKEEFGDLLGLMEAFAAEHGVTFSDQEAA